MSRKNISLSDPVEERAESIIKERGFTGLSDMLQVLIREEYERRHPSGPAPVPPAEPVNYRAGRKPSSVAKKDTVRTIQDTAQQELARLKHAAAPPKSKQ